MRVGMVGLGKLGLPVAYAMASRGLDVYGFDPLVWYPPKDTSHEGSLAQCIRDADDRMHFSSLTQVVENCDVIFVAVQTPHWPRFEGVTPLPDDRADFDYSHLTRAVDQIVRCADGLDKQVTVAVISTVLPGTMAREIIPRLGDRVSLVYNPSFIAMGTTIRDFLDPEFGLFGGDDEPINRVLRAYSVFGDRDTRVVRTSIENAELTKVAYNTFIGLKIAFANTLMEICHKTGCDVDEVTAALKHANRRLISTAYMDGGMGDGGACHPRDNIALSWLARELDLSHDLFEDVMVAREDHARWLVDLMLEHLYRDGLDRGVGILGLAYKPGSSITTGSAARLVVSVLEEKGYKPWCYDPNIATIGPALPDKPHVWLVGCKHPEFSNPFLGLKLPKGSIVIDPFRYMPEQDGVQVVRIGDGSEGVPAARRVAA